MSATSRRIPLPYLVAALLIVAGLAMSAPPACWCAADEHFGLLLHPLFPHVHGDVHSILAREDEQLRDDQAVARTVEQAPGISAGTSDSGALDLIPGLLLPVLSLTALLGFSIRLGQVELWPGQQFVRPPSPPPRRPLVA